MEFSQEREQTQNEEQIGAQSAASAQAFSETTTDTDTAFGPLRHSGPGIASLILAIVSYLLFFGFIVGSVIMTKGIVNPDHTINLDKIENSKSAITVVGIGLLGSMLGTVVGLVLGIVGLALKRRKKLFAVLGTVFNGIAVLLVIGLLVLGLTIASIQK